MVALKYFLLLTLISLECVTSKKFGGSRFKIITNHIPSFKFPGSGLFSSASDGNSGGIIGSGGAGIGAGGGGLRGGGSGGSIPGNDKTNLGDDFNEKSSKDAGAIFFFSSLLKSYSSLLDKSPYPTKMVTSAFIGALGDYLVQTFEARKTKKALDLRRVAVFATVCGLYIAPVIHVWFEYLNVMPFLTNMGKYSKAFAMMFVDQSVGATVITLGFFYAFEAAQALYPPYVTGHNFIEAGTKSVKSNLGVTMIANWKCWPIINFVNFLLVPVEYRVLFANSAAVFWNMFLSQIANREIPKEI